jgi:hypothetical protein
VVIRGAMTHWPALTRWRDPGYLRSMAGLRTVPVELGRGLHSFTSQLTLSAIYGIGGARRGCVACIKGVSGGV